MAEKVTPNVYGTQTEKRAFLDLIMLAAQRSRSIGAEENHIDDDPLMAKIMSDLFPVTFPQAGHIGIMDMLMATLEGHREIERINIFNILNMIERDLLIQSWMLHHAYEVELPTGMEFMRKTNKPD